jgi:ATP-binding cassette subfamily F protein 3
VGDVLLGQQGNRETAESRLVRAAEALEVARGPELDAALDEYSQALAALQADTEDPVRAEAGAVLAGLQLADVDLDRPVSGLSGGQKTRLGLARLLLLHPDVLLLDEPTNHLDIAGLAWLEEYLTRYSGAVLVVSHDRAFLDRSVTAILALDDVTHTAREFPGNYTDYALSVDRELEKQWAAYREQQARINRLQAAIRGLEQHARSIEGSTIDYYYLKIAKGLARRSTVQKRRLERMIESEDIVDKPGSTWKMKLELAGAPRSGQDVLQITDLRMGFAERVLFEGVELVLRYGERAVLVGPNGQGKTTLLRCIAGELRPWSGEIRLGRGVRLGYLAQEQDNLDRSATPFELIRSAAPLGETEARGFLHYFLFTGDEVFVPVGKLSYGERSRLALALLAVQGCNFLLLDEPINHLDIPSRDAFERALARFDGTVLAVVHDRYFIARLATTVWSLANGRVDVVRETADES